MSDTYSVSVLTPFQSATGEGRLVRSSYRTAQYSRSSSIDRRRRELSSLTSLNSEANSWNSYGRTDLCTRKQVRFYVVWSLKWSSLRLPTLPAGYLLRYATWLTSDMVVMCPHDPTQPWWSASYTGRWSVYRSIYTRMWHPPVTGNDLVLHLMRHDVTPEALIEISPIFQTTILARRVRFFFMRNLNSWTWILMIYHNLVPMNLNWSGKFIRLKLYGVQQNCRAWQSTEKTTEKILTLLANPLSLFSPILPHSSRQSSLTLLANPLSLFSSVFPTMNYGGMTVNLAPWNGADRARRAR